jgi:hypothetical protein
VASATPPGRRSLRTEAYTPWRVPAAAAAAPRPTTGPMKTKAELADFLRKTSGDVVMPHEGMVDIFDFAVTEKTVSDWLRSNALALEARASQGTVVQWSFRRKK